MQAQRQVRAVMKKDAAKTGEALNEEDVDNRYKEELSDGEGGAAAKDTGRGRGRGRGRGKGRGKGKGRGRGRGLSESKTSDGVPKVVVPPQMAAPSDAPAEGAISESLRHHLELQEKHREKLDRMTKEAKAWIQQKAAKAPLRTPEEEEEKDKAAIEAAFQKRPPLTEVARPLKAKRKQAEPMGVQEGEEPEEPAPKKAAPRGKSKAKAKAGVKPERPAVCELQPPAETGDRTKRTREVAETREEPEPKEVDSESKQKAKGKRPVEAIAL